jgi:hypothetical protein
MHYKTQTLYGQNTFIIQYEEAKKLKNFEVQEAVITTMKADYSNILYHITRKLSKMLWPATCVHDLHEDVWVNTFTAKVDNGRFKYLRFNLPESTLVDLKSTQLFCLK